MEYLSVLAVSLFSLAALFVLTKIMGNKQVSQLTMFDYIIGISIGSIAAEMATELEKPLRPLIAMAVYALVAFTISLLTSKFMRLRRGVFGHSTVLMKDGKLYKKNFKKTHIDLNEFLMQSRSAGYFDVSDINTAVLEPSGQISFLPFPEKRPVTAEDMKIVPSKESICYNIIMDGVILARNLRAAGRDENWLKNELEVNGLKTHKGIFLATVDENGTLSIFENYKKKQENDLFV